MKICIYSENTSLENRLKECISAFFAVKSIEPKTFSFSADGELCGTEQQQFDIAFIDIDTMTEKMLEMLRTFKEPLTKAVAFFVTEHFDENDIFAFLDAATAKHGTPRSILHLKSKMNRYCIPVDEIAYIEGYQRRLCIHTAKKDYEAVGKLSDLHNTLRSCGFIRCHQGFVVNIRHIKCIDDCEVELTNGAKLPLSVRKRKATLSEYDSFVEGDGVKITAVRSVEK